MSRIIDEENEIKEKRPILLIVLVVLSLINITWSLFNNIVSLFRGPLNSEQLEESKIEITKSINQIRDGGGMDWLEDFLRNTINMIEVTNANHLLNVLSSSFILLIGLAGVIFMFRRKEIGFHGYIIYSLLASIQIYLFVPPNSLSNLICIVSVVTSGVFVLLYGLNLKWIRKAN